MHLGNMIQNILNSLLFIQLGKLKTAHCILYYLTALHVRFISATNAIPIYSFFFYFCKYWLLASEHQKTKGTKDKIMKEKKSELYQRGSNPGH